MSRYTVFERQTRSKICQKKKSRPRYYLLSKLEDDLSSAKCTVLVSKSSTSLLLDVRTSTVATASQNVKMITSTHNLSLSFLR